MLVGRWHQRRVLGGNPTGVGVSYYNARAIDSIRAAEAVWQSGLMEQMYPAIEYAYLYGVDSE